MTLADPTTLCQTLDVPGDFVNDPQTWLALAWRQYGLTTLLAHADDGVIWGRMKDGALLTSGAALRSITLQAARLFGPSGELLLWRSGPGFAARLLLDGDTEPGSQAYLDGSQLLWGQAVAAAQNGFTPLEEGANGLRHSPPLELERGGRARLRLRHYLAEDDMGQVRIAFSRLVALEPFREE